MFTVDDIDDTLARQPRLPDSVMNLRSMRTLLVGLSFGLPVAAPSQKVARVDKVLFAGDLDGDSRPDSVVIESKAGSYELRTDRAAVYLSTLSGRVPAFATRWDETSGTDAEVTTVVEVRRGATLLVIDEPGGDYDGISVILVTPGKASVVAKHGIDYGNGTYALRRTGGRVVLDLIPAEKAELKGLPPVRPLRCQPGTQPMLTSVFDEVHGVFMRGTQRCTRLTGT